ncbi:MAG TPA: AAA family ATPase [Solirubrobacteraceae bacterium]|jgi:DNA-binding CsgD family transcriptional regulator|nr:AAA family ATPase [Solirubrobacteraceae bacterium]
MRIDPAVATAPGGGRLIGRLPELKVIEHALARLSHGAGGWLVLSGEPGVGKTRLLGELLDDARRRGHLVLTGRGAELEREMPFGVWVDALDDHVDSIGPDRLQRLVADRVAELAWVLPSVRAADPPQGTVLQDERYRAHRAVRFLIERLAAQRPVVVALDDLHWGDDASLELVAHLLRRPLRGSVLMALAYRAGQLPTWATAPLDAATRDGLVSPLTVRPLSAPESDALIGSGIGAPVRARLYELSGGNPFYLEQLASVAAREPSAFLDADGPATAPEAVAAALGQQVVRLSEPARLLAWGAAVAGEPVDLELAATTAGIDEELSLEGIDELLRAHLLAPTDLPGRYRFRHPIVRSAVHESAGEAWRRHAHARAAAALAARRGSASARAHHVEQFARVGDEQAIAVLVEAGRETAPRAPAGAARWFAAALRLLPQDASALPRRLELLMPLAAVLVAAGRLDQGLDAMLEALALVPTAAGAIRARLIAACAGCENLLGRHNAAHARLLRGLADLPDGGSPDAAELQLALASDANFDGDFAAMLEWAELARGTARAHGEPGLTAVAAALVCFANYGLGHPEPAERARVEAVTALDRIDDAALVARLDAPHYLGFAEFFCERYDDAIRHFERGLAVARASGQGTFLVPMMVGLAHALEIRGRLAEAVEMAGSAVEAARLADNRQVTGWALVAHGWTSAMCGDLDQAMRAGAEALTSIEGLDESALTRTTREHVAAMFIEAGDPERGLEQARLAGAPELARVEPGRRAWLHALLARAELAAGRRIAAEEYVVRAEREAAGLGLPLSTAAVLHSRALLLLADDRPQEAVEPARRAAELADGVGATHAGARSRTLLGTALGRAGRREEAVGLLREAESQLAACGAQRLRDEAARELRRLGRRPASRQRRGAGGEGIDALSGREREIADLVARGHTNRTIATQLFLSAKTVESHLTSVFAKLGVRSRAEVAEAIGRAQPASP